MCLSHCWGTKPFIQTTKSNLASFQSRIPWNLLPRTFQDAINLAYRIGITYIWIDSLCIIQDDEDDWRKEGSQMAEIYRGSFLTIAATKAVNSSQGLYTDTTCHRSVSLNHSRFQCQVREKVPHDLNNRDELSPLLSRAWVFQERILSHRLVHFASTELWWECMGSTTCECCRISGGVYAGFEKRHLDVEEEFDEAFVGETWRCLVSDYSFKQLTYQKDILPAIQGLAKRMYTTRRSEYLGGLWRDSLMKDLVWRRIMSSWYIDKVHPVNEFAPTWSWAAAGSSFVFDFRYSKDQKSVDLARLLGYNMIPSGDDTFGHLIRGELVLEGPCIDDHLTFTIGTGLKSGFCSSS